MPQMAPISWICLFFYFLMIFIFFNIMNFFSTLFKKNINKKISFYSSPFLLNWKW